MRPEELKKGMLVKYMSRMILILEPIHEEGYFGPFAWGLEVGETVPGKYAIKALDKLPQPRG